MKIIVGFIVLIYFFFPLSVLISQNYTPSGERGDVNSRTHSQLQANNVRTTIHNFGVTGRTSGQFSFDEQTPYEWPKNTGQVYMAINSIFIGAEVVNNNGDTLHIVEVPIFRNAPDGRSWNFEPIPGYYNSSLNQIADSQNPDTWPEFWPDRMNDSSDPGWQGEWDGYLGKDYLINGQELYYKFTDDNYDRYPDYYPDSTDLSRKGLGLIVSCRSMEFTDVPFKDMVFYSYKIKNDGTKPINKTALTMWAADFVGGNGDSQDDKFNYDLSKNLVWFYDSDNYSPSFNGNPVGAFGVAFLKTPENIEGTGNTDITNIQYIPAGSINFSSVSDNELWNDFMVSGSYVNPADIIPGEYDGFISSGYFSLQPGESKEFIFAVIFANGPQNDPDAQIRLSKINEKLDFANQFVNSGFKEGNYSVAISLPASNSTVSGNVEINWQLNGTSEQTEALIFHSSDNGDTWNYIDKVTNGNKTYQWNTENVPNGILNKIMVYVFNSSGTQYAVTERFTINNSGNNANPQLYITNPITGVQLYGNYTVDWISGDAENNQNFSVNLYYRTNPNLAWQILSQNNTNNSYNWNTTDFPNSDSYQLLCEIVWDGGSDSITVSQISISNNHPVPSDSLTSFSYYGNGTGKFEIHIVNGSEITGDNYSVHFSALTGQGDNDLFYTVFDNTNGNVSVDNAPVTNTNTEGPYFDGLRLLIIDDSLSIDRSKSSWNNSDVYDYTFETFSLSGEETGTPNAADYKIIFGDVGIDTSTSINISNNNFPTVPVNFKVINTTEQKQIDFGFIEMDNTGGEGKFTTKGIYKDRIIFLENLDGTDLVKTYWTYMDDTRGSRNPTTGDTLSIFQFKPFALNDSITFSTDKITDVKENQVIPENFKLEQNYPNPFNPSTIISYSLPVNSFVAIKIYDVLGRKLKTLVNSSIAAGKHQIVFNGENFASGIYFYQLEAKSRNGKNSVLTKKMVLLR